MRCGSLRDEHWRQCPVDQLTVGRGDGEASAGGLGNDHAVKGSLRSQSSWLAIVASAESITGSVAFMPARASSRAESNGAPLRRPIRVLIATSHADYHRDEQLIGLVFEYFASRCSDPVRSGDSPQQGVGVQQDRRREAGVEAASARRPGAVRQSFPERSGWEAGRMCAVVPPRAITPPRDGRGW